MAMAMAMDTIFVIVEASEMKKVRNV